MPPPPLLLPLLPPPLLCSLLCRRRRALLHRRPGAPAAAQGPRLVLQQHRRQRLLRRRLIRPGRLGGRPHQDGHHVRRRPQRRRHEPSERAQGGQAERERLVQVSTQNCSYHMFFSDSEDANMISASRTLDNLGFTVLAPLSWVLIPVLSVVLRSYPPQPVHLCHLQCP